LEIRTCIISDAGRPAAHKKQWKYMSYTCFEGKYKNVLTFNPQKNFKKNSTTPLTMHMYHDMLFIN
jgi:hypothetical protein